MDLLPVTLLTGFLGSGKSTLLTEILRQPDFLNTAVVVNEFGEIGLDGILITHSDDQIVEMTSGCLCCTIRGDIRQTLLDLHSKRANGDIPDFDRVIVESTGLADPAPVVHTLMSDSLLARRYILGGVVTTVDALNGAASLDNHTECEKQAAVADRLVITKADLATSLYSTDMLKELNAKLSALNPTAVILDRHDSTFEHHRLFDTPLFNPATKSMDVRSWLNAEAADENQENGHHHNHANNSDIPHQHDVTRHGSVIRSFTLTFDEPVTIEAFAGSLEALALTQGSNLLRIKGIVNTVDRPGVPLAIHGVQHVFHDPVWLDQWPDEDHQTKLVFITNGIERETLDQFFNAWISSSKGSWR
ncbi:MAG: GTP-binding protein [Rhodospirillaceae bacterium]|nr:GTP-binding protein [Rhodospirillaceae bacterium]